MKPFTCLRCGHTWYARTFDKDGNPIKPAVCPKKNCHSPYWDKPRKEKEVKDHE